MVNDGAHRAGSRTVLRSLDRGARRPAGVAHGVVAPVTVGAPTSGPRSQLRRAAWRSLAGSLIVLCGIAPTARDATAHPATVGVSVIEVADEVVRWDLYLETGSLAVALGQRPPERSDDPLETVDASVVAGLVLEEIAVQEGSHRAHHEVEDVAVAEVGDLPGMTVRRGEGGPPLVRVRSRFDRAHPDEELWLRYQLFLLDDAPEPHDSIAFITIDDATHEHTFTLLEDRVSATALAEPLPPRGRTIVLLAGSVVVVAAATAVAFRQRRRRGRV
jgi:hypothetical protein